MIKVALRQKKISGGRKSLYLDFYPPIPHPETGKPTRREFLGIYIYEPVKVKKRGAKEIPVYSTNPAENEVKTNHNTEKMKFAEQIRQKRENFLNKPEIYTEYEKELLRKKENGERDFLEYFKTLADKRKKSNHDNWVSAYKYLDRFTDGQVKFADLNEKFFEDFKEYLLTSKSSRSNKTTLAQNSALSYFNKVKATLRQAFKDGILNTDLNAKIKPIKPAETRREYLTLQELNKLVQTPCNSPLLKRAALFSALTGLRFSDIQKMKWSELVHNEGEGYFLNFQQKKTEGMETLPISEQAYNLTGERGEPAEKVFKGLRYSAYHNRFLFQWIGAAGITKHITFHCFRHTYATLQLKGGTDIYTVSKMLGHKDLKTTQIYTKIVDKTKRAAADRIQLDFGEEG